MRVPYRFVALLGAICIAAPPQLHAQSTAADDSAHWRATKADLDSIGKDKRATAYSKRAQLRIRVRDSLRVFRPSVPPQPIPAVARIEVNSGGVYTLAVGDSMQLTAVPRTASGVVVAAPISWGVTPLALCGISGTGRLNAKGAGSCTVTARADTVVGSRVYTITGIAPNPPPDSVIVVKPDTTSPVVLGFDGPAELPRATVDVTMPLGYTIVNVPASASALQAAVNSSACRTELRGAPAFDYAPITLPVKFCNDRVHTIIRTANNIPLLARGTRVTPALAAQRQQSRIVTSGGNIPAVVANAGVHGYYFEDVTIWLSAGQVNGLVTLGTQQTTLAQVPGDFVFSHVFSGGGSLANIKRCWYWNSSTTALVDSDSRECHSNDGDSQWIEVLNGPGPFLILNNYGEGGHEVVMFGGGDPSILNLVPSDITIRGNHITRPVAWKGVWGAKNLIECKNARRMLIEGNVIENVWADGQTGYGFLCKSNNQEFTAPWSTSQDVTFRFNLMRNVGAGINLCAACQGTVVPATRMSVHDNIIKGVNVAPYNGEARQFQFLGALTNISVEHNTVIGAVGVETAISFDGQPPKISAFRFRSNGYNRGLYDVHGGSGGSDWKQFVDTASSLFTNNLNYLGTDAAAGFDAQGYYTGTFPSHDGRPLGADAAKVYAMTAGAVLPVPVGARPRSVANPRAAGYRPTSAAARQRNTRGAGPSVR